MKNIILFLFCFGYAFAQPEKDSIFTSQIQKELQALKMLREKDSVKLALILSEIQSLIHSDNSKKDATIDSSLSKKTQEIDLLRNKTNGVPIVFKHDTIFFIYTSYAPYSIETRKKYVEEKINDLYKNPFFNADSIKIKKSDDYINITYQKEIISGVTISDALWANTTAENLANKQAKKIKEVIAKYKVQNNLPNTLSRIGEFLLTIGISVGLIWFINYLFRYLKQWILSPKRRFLKGVKIRDYELVRKEHFSNLLTKSLFLLKIFIFISLFATIIPLSFRIFPSTKHLSERILEWTLNPITSFWNALVEYIPNLFNIVIIIIIARYVLRLLRFFSLEIERGALKIMNFHPEWAKTTYNIVRFLLLMLVLVIVFPYLPGADSDAFKGISVFLGVLISFGSSSAVSNAIAGLVITYMRPFRVGDWIKTGEITGVVLERDALVTRLRTINNEDVSVPNSAILTGATINYSSLGKERGLALNVRVKVRYEYSHNLVEELLIEAALLTQDIAKAPCPYVFQLSLEELNAIYELNAYTFNPDNMYFIKSDLVKNIQNTFKQANVEIYTMQYVEIREHKTKK
ncbi:MAG: mechanosensitive ion channel [Capnocytophaga sp.]|nr:mechanosensitive ion channel [Capnocytophaga sp.]